MIKQEELKELIFKELYSHTSAKYFNVDSNSYMYTDFKKAIKEDEEVKTTVDQVEAKPESTATTTAAHTDEKKSV